MATKRNSINLLYKNSEVSQAVKQIRRWSLVVLGVYILLLFGVFAAQLVFSQIKNRTVAENEILSQEINNYKEREGLFLTLKNRVGLSRVMFSHADSVQQETVRKIISIAPEGVDIRSIKSEKPNKFDIEAQASNSSALTALMEVLRKSEFSYLHLGNITQSNGKYRMGFQVR